jgi:hypothetical protein
MVCIGGTLDPLGTAFLVDFCDVRDELLLRIGLVEPAGVPKSGSFERNDDLVDDSGGTILSVFMKAAAWLRVSTGMLGLYENFRPVLGRLYVACLRPGLSARTKVQCFML